MFVVHSTFKEGEKLVKISVIIPVYNVEKYLRECLDSVISQTLKDIEIICINDGSTDGSLNILQKYAGQDKRIKVIDKKNEGVGAARNDGIKYACGEFVCFIDPDDYYPTNDILESLYNKAVENNVFICGGEFARFTNKNRELNQNYGDSFEGYLFPKCGVIKYSDYQFDYGYHRFIYDREFLIKNNIFYPNYKRFQDPPFFVHAMICAKEFYALDKITYAYRCAHQKVRWNKEKVYGLLNGILDNMKYANEYNFSMLSHYSLTRFAQHYNQVAEFIFFDLKAIAIIIKMGKYNAKVKQVIIKKSFKFTEAIFSIKNTKNKKHKVITVLGIKIKIRRRNKNA